MVSGVALFEAYGLTAEKAARNLRDALARGEGELIVAEGGTGPLGFSWFIPGGAFARSGYLRLMVVAKEARRLGVGRALMAELERRHLDPGGIVVLTNGENRGGRAFYEALGYGKVGEIPDYVSPGLDEWIYFKPPHGDSVQ